MLSVLCNYDNTEVYEDAANLTFCVLFKERAWPVSLVVVRDTYVTHLRRIHKHLLIRISAKIFNMADTLKT